MFNELTKKIISTALSYVLVFQSLHAANPNTATRLDWNMIETNTSVSSVPSNVKYFQYFDVLPDDITMPIYKNMNLSTVAGKKLFVGYGTVDPDGNMCRYFPELGRTECLPWWRIEREYAIPETNATTITDFLQNLTMLYPPKNIQYCREWKTMEEIAGGKVTCTSYYDKRKSVECLANPMQSQCYVDQCSNGIKTSCEYIGSEEGDTTTLIRPVVGNNGVPVGSDMIVGLKTHQYTCPSGYMPGKECNDWIYGVTYPFECKAPTSVELRDGEYKYCDTNPKPYFDNTGTLVGFTSDDKCSDGFKLDGSVGPNGKQRLCPVNNYSQTQKVCEDPIIQVESSIGSQTIQQKRTFDDHETSVLFGDEVGDIFASDPLCLRLNTVEGARQKDISVRITGTGYLDDDIYIFTHKSNGSYNKIYCNMQHNEASAGNAKKWVTDFSGYTSTGSKTITATLTMDTGEISTISKTIQIVSSGGLNNGSIDLSAAGALSVDRNTSFTTIAYSPAPVVSVKFDFGYGIEKNGVVDASSVSMVNKNYAGDTLQCIDNDGNYNFDQTVSIKSSDVVSVQQASEAENATKEHMFARNHFRSTPLTIHGVSAAPATFPANYPAYPTHGGGWLKTWDNALTNLSIMFPFAGAYEIFVYGGASEYENKLLSQATLTIDDFKDMPSNGYMQLKLGRTMQLSPGMTDGNTSNACREDDLVDWGGGVWSCPNGSKGDMSGCSAPDDTHSKANSAYNVVVKDLLTGTVTPIHLVYPLPYPNRIFISRLNVVENRKYRCYNEFPDVGMSAGCIVGAQNETQPVSDYRGHSVNMIRNTTVYCDVTSEKVVGCNSEKTIQRDGGITYENANLYETKDNSNMFMSALAGAQLSEQMMHIWSGWHGECESGIFTDFSWASDPMSLASLAMSAYSSVTYGADQAASAGQKLGELAGSNGEVASAFNSAVESGMTAAEIAKTGGAVADYAEQIVKLEYWSEALSTSIYNTVQSNLSTVESTFTSMATSAQENVADMMSGALENATSSGMGTATKDAISGIAEKYNESIQIASTAYNNTINIGDALTSLEGQLNALGDALAVSTDPDVIASLEKAIEETSAQYASLQNTLAGTVYSAVESTSKSISSFFTDPATSKAAQEAAANSTIDAIGQGAIVNPKSFLEKLDEINQLQDIGFYTIKWTDIAAAGYQMYANVAAKQDEMIKAWKAQQAYVLSGEGTNNDIASNAYASCMASVGASFINTISYAGGAKDSNTTSQELLTPTKNPMRISFQSLYELKAIVGEKFLEASYKVMDFDYNMQMLTIVALNSAAYTQLTQIVCGGYQVSAVANSLNSAADGSDPSMLDALSNMSGEQMATMGLSVACGFAGPYAFACSLGLKVLTSFSSGNACTDEKIAMSQDPIQLKTNKFQKFGQCHATGSSCSKKILKKCILKKYHYCCYDQIMTRIFAEGVKEQRGTGWNSCNDITINDLKDVSFTPCQEGQDPKDDKCFPLSKYQELTGELKRQIKKGLAVDGDTFMNQVQNAMEVAQ